jgi:hypothetical protein
MKFLVLILAAAAQAQESVRDVFDCAMRNFAVEYAQHIQPFRAAGVFEEIAFALNGTPEKAAGCNVTFTPSPAFAASPARASRFPFLHAPAAAPGAGGGTFYVSLSGSDANPGTQAAPFATLAKALSATRATPGADTILLRGGVYYSQPTLVLLAGDEGLTIQNYPGEEVWLSGAAPLPPAGVWKPYNVSNSTPPTPTPQWIHEMNQNDVFNGAGGAFVKNKTQSWQDCEALCKADGACKAWTWHDQNQAGYALDCYFRPDGVWDPVPEAGHVAGAFTAPPAPTPQNVWAMDLSSFGVTSIKGLRAPDGSRLTRARYPNGFPETKGFMPPAVFRASWTPQQLPRAPDTQVDLPKSALDRNTSISSFQTFTAGIGGTCDRFQPSAGYWCSKGVQGGGSVIYFVPIAMQADKATLPNMPYKDPRGAIVQTWRCVAPFAASLLLPFLSAACPLTCAKHTHTRLPLSRKRAHTSRITQQAWTLGLMVL